MGTYEQLKASITAAIKSNGNQEITGAILQNILLSIVNTVGSGAVFKGVATPTTNPGNRDENCFYLAGTAGTYSNFAGFVLNEGLAVLQNSNGSWVGTKILSIASKADTDDIGGAHHLKYGQAPIINLYNVEPISACTENNKLWFKTDGHLYYRQSGIDYDLGIPAYLLYYSGSKIYKWNGSGFTEMNSGSGESVSLDFNTGESVEDISLFGSKASIDNKTDAQLALMMPTGAVIKALFDAIDSIDTSGGTYDGIDQVVTFSFVASTRVLTLKQSGRTAKTLTLPLASTSSPGLMSAQDKKDLASKANLILVDSEKSENMLKLSEWPRAVIKSITPGFSNTEGEIYIATSLAAGEPNTLGVLVGNNRINLGLPNPYTLYVTRDTGKLYLYDVNTFSFTEISQSGGGSGGSVIDDLDTGGSNVPLSAEQGKNLKLALESLRTALANLAFEGNAPTFPWDEEVIPEGDISDYVQDGLVLHLDGINKGGVSGQWTDLIGGVDFPNHGATELENGWQFDGVDDWMGYNDTSKSLLFNGDECTIEVCFEDSKINQGAGSHDAGMFLVGLGASSTHGSNEQNAIYVNTVYNGNGTRYINGVYVGSTDSVWKDPLIDTIAKNTLSMNKSVAVHNGTELETLGANHWANVKGGRTIGAQWHSTSGLTEYATGKIFSIRVYNRILSKNEMLQNQRVDNARFNLGLTLPE